MKTAFNLFSANVRKTILAKKNFVLSGSQLAGLAIVIIAVIVGVFTFVISTYYDKQLTDKGNQVIDLMSKQNKFADVITDLNNYRSRKSVIDNISKSRAKFENVIKEIDRVTNHTTLNTSVEKESLGGGLDGVVTTAAEAIAITRNMRASDYFTEVSLHQLIKGDGDYSYNITFKVNGEKL